MITPDQFHILNHFKLVSLKKIRINVNSLWLDTGLFAIPFFYWKKERIIWISGFFRLYFQITWFNWETLLCRPTQCPSVLLIYWFPGKNPISVEFKAIFGKLVQHLVSIEIRAIDKRRPWIFFCILIRIKKQKIQFYSLHIIFDLKLTLMWSLNIEWLWP